MLWVLFGPSKHGLRAETFFGFDLRRSGELSLARSNIEFYWRQTFTTVVILAFVGLLIFHQVGGVLGQWRTLGVVEREVSADLVIAAARQPNAPFQSLNASIPGGVRASALTHPNVAYIEGFNLPLRRVDYADMAGLDRPRRLDIDLSERSLMFPRSVPDETRQLLAGSGVVAVNRAFARRFDVALGDIEIIGDEPVQIVAILNVYEGMGPAILRAPPLGAQGPNLQQVEAVLLREFGVSIGVTADRGLLLKLHDPTIADRTAAELRTLLPRSISVLSPEQLIVAAGLAQLSNNARVRAFFITAAFTILICSIIAAQTLRGAILTHRDQYGALMALGVSRWRLVCTAMETAFWVGALSSVLAVSVAFVMARVLQGLGTNFALTLEVVLGTVALLMVISFIAGLASLGALMRVAPAALLR